jgi:hypothetical protein
VSEDEHQHVGPPTLVLQEIVTPSQVPQETRHWIVQALDHQECSWDDVNFAGRALALIEGTDQPEYEELEWVVALNARVPKVGEVVRSDDGWSTTLGTTTYSDGVSSRGFRAWVYESLTTEPAAT